MTPGAAKQTFVILFAAGVLFFLAGAHHSMKMNFALFWSLSSFLIAGRVMLGSRGE
jgi:hypothetical protein